MDGAATVKLNAADVPPGAGFTTLSVAVVAAAMSTALIAAVSCVPLAKVVVRASPFHCTTEPAAKPVPLTRSENAGPPAVADDGETAVIVGAGGGTVSATRAGPEKTCKAVATCTVPVPAALIRLAGMVAVNCVGLTNVVGEVQLAVPAGADQQTLSPAANPDPLTVRAKACPTKALVGETVVSTGTRDAVISVTAIVAVLTPKLPPLKLKPMLF